MNLPLTKLIRCLTVLVTLLSWWTVSNHCALASVLVSSKAEICDHCHDHADQDGGDKSAPESNMTCCKVLKATDAGKWDWKPFTLATGNFDYDTLAEHSLATAHVFTVNCLATGPPDPASLPVLILRRCHPGNAPPLP